MTGDVYKRQIHIKSVDECNAILIGRYQFTPLVKHIRIHFEMCIRDSLNNSLRFSLGMPTPESAIDMTNCFFASSTVTEKVTFPPLGVYLKALDNKL